jgi:hypothetical protein
MSDLLYSIVRYVPDAARDEAVNVGVVVAGEDRLTAKFLRPQQLSRLKRFGRDEDFAFLRSLEREIKQSSEPHQEELLGSGTSWDLQTLEQASGGWGGSVRVTPPRPAAGSENEALEWLFAQLVASPPVRHRAPDRRVIKSKVRRVLLRSVRAKYRRGRPERLVKAGDVVSGHLEDHVFDFTLRNGRLLHVVQTVSFDVSGKEALARDLDATKWALTDMVESGEDAPVAIVAMGDRQNELRANAEQIFPELGARFVPDDELNDWAEELENSLPERLSAR